MNMSGAAGYINHLLTFTMLVSGSALADINNCTVTLSPSEQSYGQLLRSRQTFVSTSQGNAAELSPRSSNLTVSCPQAERLDLRFAGSSFSSGAFSFGQKGKVRVTLSSAVLDGNAVQILKTKHQGVAVSPVFANSQMLSSGDEVTFGSSGVKGMNLNATITVTPQLLESAFSVKDANVQEVLLNIELLAEN